VTWYDLLKFLHVSGAAIWVGGATIVQFLGVRATADPSGERLTQFALDVEWIGSRVLTAAAGGTFLLGLGLVWNASFWSFGDDWIVIGLVLFAVTFLAGVGFFSPETGRIGKQIAAEGSRSPAVRARITRLIVLSRIDLVILFLLVFDMAVKPSFDDGWTIVGALIAAGALAIVLVLIGRPSRVEAASAVD
jgi:uncharacterized membrane protein